MPTSVLKDLTGPDAPLGLVVVATPGTPVGVMSLIDSGNVNAPNTATSANSSEYTPVFYSLLFQAVKAGASHGLVNNTGNIYICRAGYSGGRDDTGCIIATLAPGAGFTLLVSPGTLRGFSGYRYTIDADNAGDSCLITGMVA